MRNKKLIILLSVVFALVLIIVVCGATFLVRDVSAYSYYVDSPAEYDAKVIEAAKIKSNSSMFFLDEKEIKDRIEGQCPDVGVINIERKFPDSVSINYVVYKKLFQYSVGDKYYKCYSSGKITTEEPSLAPSDNCFIIYPRDAVSDKPGEYFQPEGGYDRQMISRFMDYMHTTPAPRDEQVAEHIRFIDLSRAGYFYIRTLAGCSIEIHGTGDDFAGMLAGAWSIFMDPSPDSPIASPSGIIRAYVRTGIALPDGGTEVGSSSGYRFTYSPKYDEEDYRKDYVVK